MSRLLFLLLLLIVAPAHAGTVGVVVTGDSELKNTLADVLDTWLRGHGHSVGREALPRDATSSLLNCMVIDDESCARDIVDARAKTESIVFSEIRRPRTKSSNATTITLYWLVRGKEPVGMRRACESCSPGLLKSTLDEMLGTVFGASNAARGKLIVHSKPEGASVMLDNEHIGITPLEREVPAGDHKIVLMKSGRKVGERTVKIQRDVAADITIPVRDSYEPPAPPSQAFPSLLIGLGGVAVIGGAVLFITSETDDGSKPYYRETRPAGVAFGALGLVMAGVGAYLFARNAGDSAPIAVIDRHGGMIGWAGIF